MMLLQRARVAESRVKNKLSNGPLRAQSNVLLYSAKYSVTSWHALVVGDMFVSCKVHSCLSAVNQGGTTDKYYSSLTDVLVCQGRFCFISSFGRC